jgi:hypothetical protein
MRPAIGLPLKARARRQLSIKLRNICLPRPGTRAFRALRPSLRGYGVRIRLSIAMLQRSKTALVRRFTAYQEALVHEERVRQILRLPIEKAKRPCPETTDFSKPDTASAVTGFYTIETSAGREFAGPNLPPSPRSGCRRGRCVCDLTALPCLDDRRGRSFSFSMANRCRNERKRCGAMKSSSGVRSRKAGVSRLLWICEPLIERGTPSSRSVRHRCQRRATPGVALACQARCPGPRPRA